jgi:SAM-dependent methyltransferase
VTWKSSSSKHKQTAQESASLKRLESVRRQRRPFLGLSRRIVEGTLAQFLPTEGPVVEIGMGDGQLRERLPEQLLPRVRHTEPFAAASRDFRKRHPGVEVLQAPAERLPVEDGSVAAVLALCVMDVVPDVAAVVSELRRVLRPGGRFIHWLDMSTVLSPVVASLSGTNLVPFPNVFSDPAESEWPEDLFLMPREQLALVVALLGSAGHGLAKPLAQYLKTFSATPLAVGAASAELIQLQDNAQLRQLLQAGFRAAFELAAPAVRERLAAFEGRPVSSARHFEQRLLAWFGKQSGFDVEESRLVRAWESAPASAAPFPYMSCCVGEQRSLTYTPDALLCADAVPPSEGSALLEQGIFVFVASRI